MLAARGRVRLSLGQGLVHVLGVARAAAGDDGDRYHVGQGSEQVQVVALPGAVRVHAVHYDLSRAQFHGPGRPLNRVQAR